MPLNSGDKTTQWWQVIKFFKFCEAPYQVELKSAVTLDYKVYVPLSRLTIGIFNTIKDTKSEQ